MRVILVHHADALGPEVDPQRPLSTRGVEQAERLAARAAESGYGAPVIWHSGKLRARQTADAFLRRAPFTMVLMVRGLRPDDPPDLAVAALAAESTDVMIVGHLPNLTGILEVLVPGTGAMPLHGLAVIERVDGGWRREI